MQSMNLNLTAGQNLNIGFDGDLFVYERGVGVPGSGDYRIVVKPDGGNEIVLRPGQRFRTRRSTNWMVSPYDDAVGIAGVIIIGSGEFDDASIDQTVRLDGEFNNNVSINNTTANRIPVSIDETQTQKVSGAIVSYNNSVYSTANVPFQVGSVYALKVVDAALNVNGIIINRARIRGTGGASASQVHLVARGAGAIVSSMDGDILMTADYVANGPYDMVQNLSTDGQIRVPAGKSLWVWTIGPVATHSTNMLYTIL